MPFPFDFTESEVRKTNGIFSKLITMVRQVFHKVTPYKNIAAVEQLETPLSNEMAVALETWYSMYRNDAPWLKDGKVFSLNLPAFICSELARQITLEMKWNITGKEHDADGNALSNPRAEYLAVEFDKLMVNLRTKLEQGCAAGGMVIKPYPKNGRIHFDFCMDWSLYPVAFDDDGNISDVIFRDTFIDGKTVYTRLERHRMEGEDITITQRAFKSNVKDVIGVEIPLSDVPQWAELEPEATVKAADGQLFGWYKVPMANTADVDCPMGASVFDKAVRLIRDADEQYSRIKWEYEGTELAIDVDPTALRPRKDGGMEMPQLNERLFRGVDLGTDDNYHVFSPPIRDASLFNGLNKIFMRIEDLCGLSRGTISDPNAEARTATELKIQQQRSYATIADNQTALERALRDVLRVMDKYADIYNLAPKGDYEVSFEWDDSIITDSSQQLSERLTLMNAGCVSKEEIRAWYFGETQAQAKKAIEDLQAQQLEQMVSMLPAMTD